MNVTHHPKRRAQLEAQLAQRQEECARIDAMFDPATMPPATRSLIEREAARRGIAFDQLRPMLHLDLYVDAARRLAEVERDLAAFD